MDRKRWTAIIIFVTLLSVAPQSWAAPDDLLFRKDANLHTFIRGLLRQSRIKANSQSQSENTRWINNYRLVNDKEVTDERTHSEYQSG